MQVGEDCETVTELGVMYCNNLPHMLLVTLKHIVSITSECQIDIKGDTTGLPGNGLKKTVSRIQTVSFGWRLERVHLCIHIKETGCCTVETPHPPLTEFDSLLTI